MELMEGLLHTVLTGRLGPLGGVEKMRLGAMDDLEGRNRSHI